MSNPTTTQATIPHARRGRPPKAKPSPAQAAPATRPDPLDLDASEGADDFEAPANAPLASLFGDGVQGGDTSADEPRELPAALIKALADPNAVEPGARPALPKDAAQAGGKTIYVAEPLMVQLGEHRYNLGRGDALPKGVLSAGRIRDLARQGVLTDRVPKPRAEPLARDISDHTCKPQRAAS